MDMRQEMLEVLRGHWGYDAFRPLQAEIVESVLTGHDTLGLLPTGGGKSITFQVPALMLPGLTVVVTPLISLMKDQVDNLLDVGIRAVCVNSGMTRREQTLAIQRCEAGKAKILYLSPEKLQIEGFQSTLRRLDISLIVVDEAHCISQWGYDFRPSYLRIAALRDMHPQAPVLALTASATPEVVQDIMTQLRFRDRDHLFARSFSRENLSYVVRHAESKTQQLLGVFRGVPGTAIVYVRSRRKTREIAEELKRAGISADYYHAGLEPEEKERRQNEWKRGDVRVMVATNAFGMGIDKPDVRAVVHISPPPSLEEYYQEAGRAGRDGLPAYAVLIVSGADRGVLTRRIGEEFPPREFIARVYDLLGPFLNVGVGAGYNQLYDFNIHRFCLVYDLQPVLVDSALKILSRAGYIDYQEEVSARARIMMLMPKHELYDLRLSDHADRVLQAVLRLYSGIFADYVYISEASIAAASDLHDDEVYQALLALSRMHVLHYVPRRETPYIVFTTAREEARHIVLPDAVYKDRRRKMEERVEAVKRYAFTDGDCRVNIMLRYFGEQPTCTCGKCDVCRAQRTLSPDRQKSLSDKTLQLVKARDGITVAELAQATATSPARIIAAIRPLLDDGTLTLRDQSLMLNS